MVVQLEARVEAGSLEAERAAVVAAAAVRETARATSLLARAGSALALAARPQALVVRAKAQAAEAEAAAAAAAAVSPQPLGLECWYWWRAEGWGEGEAEAAAVATLRRRRWRGQLLVLRWAFQPAQEAERSRQGAGSPKLPVRSTADSSSDSCLESAGRFAAGAKEAVMPRLRSQMRSRAAPSSWRMPASVPCENPKFENLPSHVSTKMYLRCSR